MATLLYRLGRVAHRRWALFLTAWLIALVGVGAVSTTLAQPTSDSFSIPGIASEKAANLQEELFPQSEDPADQASATVVVAAPKGHQLSERTYQKAVDQLVTNLARLPQMAALSDGQGPVNPVQASAALKAKMVKAATTQGTPRPVALQNAQALSPLSANGRVGLITWSFDVQSPADVRADTQQAVSDAMAGARHAGLRVEANGPALQSQPAQGASEGIGVAVALIVLVLTFGSLVAAGLPLLTAGLGVGLGMLGISAMTAFTDIPSTTSALATMIGLAVGIDYALFILARYRSELQRLGGDSRDPDVRGEAVGRAVGTAGSAVTFAGLTVIIALAALAVVQIPFMTAMGLGAAATVAIAVLVALTLLPAILGMTKSKAFGARLRKQPTRQDERGLALNNGVRWARLVGRKPVAVVVVVVAFLGVLAVPAPGMHLALPTDSTAPTNTTQRQAADLVSDAFGPGRQSPLMVVV
ncbi:MAG: MMPL family transporter, partial [Nocardioidaceae bacterium]